MSTREYMNAEHQCSKFKRECYDIEFKNYDSCEECLLEAAEITLYKLDDFFETVKRLWSQVYKHVYTVVLVEGGICRKNDEDGNIKVLYDDKYINVTCPFCGYDGRLHHRYEVVEIQIKNLGELNFDSSNNIIDGYVYDMNDKCYDIGALYYSKEKAVEVCNGFNNYSINRIARIW